MCIRRRIYYHHTDAGGVVYYANYLHFFEESRTELFRQKGIDLKELSAQGVMFVVCRQEVDYRHPAFYADELKIETIVAKAQGVRIEFAHNVVNQKGEAICSARTVMACVSSELRPKPIPEDIKSKLVEL